MDETGPLPLLLGPGLRLAPVDEATGNGLGFLPLLNGVKSLLNLAINQLTPACPSGSTRFTGSPRQ